VTVAVLKLINIWSRFGHCTVIVLQDIKDAHGIYVHKRKKIVSSMPSGYGNGVKADESATTISTSLSPSLLVAVSQPSHPHVELS
jgi:hypothetical protein